MTEQESNPGGARRDGSRATSDGAAGHHSITDRPADQPGHDRGATAWGRPNGDGTGRDPTGPDWPDERNARHETGRHETDRRRPHAERSDGDESTNGATDSAWANGDGTDRDHDRNRWSRNWAAGNRTGGDRAGRDRTDGDRDSRDRDSGDRDSGDRDTGDRAGRDENGRDRNGRNRSGRDRNGRDRAGRNEVAAADPVGRARETCLNLLAVRPRTRAELRQALLRRGTDEETADRVLARLNEVGLIDDAAFAEQWVHSRHTYQGMARRALAAELRRKGVADPTARAAVDALDSEAEEARARELVRKRLRTVSTADEVTKIRRLVGILARKGYAEGMAYRVVRDELRAAGAETDMLDGALPD